MTNNFEIDYRNGVKTLVKYRRTDMVIHSPAGSYAIEYAKENNIKFVEY